jgi:MoaA/NifB/PqqE/SkfB family radical SAM enzyme
MTTAETIKLAAFFGALAIKEHVKPDLHVRPLVAELFLTDNCNLRCVSCACWRSNTKDELTTAQWKNVLDQLVALRMHKLNFTGGEPLLRRDAVEILGYAHHDAGARHLHLNSNAILLTEPMADAVLAAGVRSFNISVDGTQPAHDLIRGRQGAFDRTMAHLRNLVALRDEYGLKVRMNFTLMRDNVHELVPIARLAQQEQVRLYLNLATDSTFLFRHQDVTGETRIPQEELAQALTELDALARQDRRWLPRFSDLNYIPQHFDDLLQSDLPCAESQLKLMIHSRGEIGGCWGHDPDLNVATTPVRDVIDSQGYREQHEKLFRKECVGCGSNYSLNLRWRPGTYAQDLLWRLHRRDLGTAAPEAAGTAGAR